MPTGKFVRVLVQYGPDIRTGSPVEVMRVVDNMVGGAKCPNEECVIGIFTSTRDAENTLTVVTGWQSRIEGK